MEWISLIFSVSAFILYGIALYVSVKRKYILSWIMINTGTVSAVISFVTIFIYFMER